jgi:glycerophosphoryl diester phosphodiesterase
VGDCWGQSLSLQALLTSLDCACAQELVIDTGLKEVAAYADGIGPDKGIIAPAPGGIIRFTTDFVKRCVHFPHTVCCLTLCNMGRTTCMLTHGTHHVDT